MAGFVRVIVNLNVGCNPISSISWDHKLVVRTMCRPQVNDTKIGNNWVTLSGCRTTLFLENLISFGFLKHNVSRTLDFEDVLNWPPERYANPRS